MSYKRNRSGNSKPENLHFYLCTSLSSPHCFNHLTLIKMFQDNSSVYYYQFFTKLLQLPKKWIKIFHLKHASDVKYNQRLFSENNMRLIDFFSTYVNQLNFLTTLKQQVIFLMNNCIIEAIKLVLQKSNCIKIFLFAYITKISNTII